MMNHTEEEASLIDLLTGVHTPEPTCDIACVIHNPSEGPHRDLHLHWRDDRGIFERICDHGIGHPDPDQFPYWEATDQDYQSVHGCDGCCGGFYVEA